MTEDLSLSILAIAAQVNKRGTESKLVISKEAMSIAAVLP
jgi:hypothetical protein